MLEIIKFLGRVSLWILMIGLGPVVAAEPSSGWKAGAARVDTTPRKPVRMAGYASRTAPSQGVAHPLAAKALAVADASDHKVVFVTCDIIAFRHAFTNRVIERVKARYGLPREDVVLFASHNHAGPSPVEPTPGDSARPIDPPGDGFEDNIAYMIELETRIVDLIGEAIAKMQPARLSYGIGRAHFALNRREPTAAGIKLGKNPAGPVDESVPIVHVQTATGKPLAIVFGYACHNTTLRPDMMKIAADFAGFAQDRIEHIDRGRPVVTEYPHYSVQAFALGDQLTLLALSGEVVVDYAIRLQKELGGENRALWVAAYANDVIGYIPSLRVKKEGGYEGGEAFFGSTWPTPLADDIESIVVNAAHEAVKKVRGNGQVR